LTGASLRARREHLLVVPDDSTNGQYTHNFDKSRPNSKRNQPNTGQCTMESPSTGPEGALHSDLGASLGFAVDACDMQLPPDDSPSKIDPHSL
jgi:hypothetical protein